MIKNEHIAKQISDIMLDVGYSLNRSVAIVMDNCPNDELIVYRKIAGKIMADILLDILNPIYSEHPGIKPEQLK